MAASSAPAWAQGSKSGFEQWVEAFRARARARGISDATYTRVMSNIKPDTAVFELNRSQPEFNEQVWQYLNRRVSDWRITTGKEKAQEYAPLFARIEKDYGVDRSVMLGLWGIESAFGDPDVQKNHMRPVIPALAALAWGEPRRRAYWEQELLNALVIIERGWSTPEEMRGSWAGAMGHTQWMPEVWLNVGLDYDGDGRVTPVRQARRRTRRHGAISGQARQVSPRRALGLRGPRRHRRDPAKARRAATTRGRRPASSAPTASRSRIRMRSAKLWVPVSGGPDLPARPEFLCRALLQSVDELHARRSCISATASWGRAVRRSPSPAANARPTLAEVQEIQKRLTTLGFDTGGTDGRVGNDTMIAVRNFQRKVGMQPADGYAGVKLLARLRQAS